MAEARLRPDAFDRFAADYDAGFAHTAPGRILREAVWRRLPPARRALDLGCGTGEDALFLARSGAEVTAADASPAMLDLAWRKAMAAGVGDRVETRLFDLNAPVALDGSYDLVLSNFGALNCALDLVPLAEVLRAAVAPGGTVVLVVMGRFCAWESLWYGLRGKGTAVRRWRGRSSADIGGETIPIRYWRPRDIAAAFTGFTVEAVHPIGLFLPPSDLFPRLERHPRLLRRLARWEARGFPHASLAGLADHHLTLLRREDAPS
jgi:SAM-dependent methyltransferase